jgi:small-conductance mechanosensitive channel
LEILRAFRREGIDMPPPLREMRNLSGPEGDKLPPGRPAG